MTLRRTASFILLLAIAFAYAFVKSVYTPQEAPKNCIYKIDTDYDYTRALNCECSQGSFLRQGNTYPCVIVCGDTLTNVTYFRNY